VEAERLETLDREAAAFEQRAQRGTGVRSRRRLDHPPHAPEPQQPDGAGPRRVEEAGDVVALVVGRDHEPAAGTEDTVQLGHGPLGVEHVLDHLRAEDEVELRVGERDRLEVAPAEVGVDAAARGLEDPLGDVHPGPPRRQLGRERLQVTPVAAACVEERLCGQLLPHERADPGELPVDSRVGKRPRLAVLLGGAILVESPQRVGRPGHRLGTYARQESSDLLPNVTP
jgi:hypothetical protein